jgi:hypothetical protein
VFPYPLSAREGQDFCSGTGQEDRNVINLENGVISWAFKGHSDECNNDLLHTYHLHKQLFPCPIARKVTRNVPRKGTLVSGSSWLTWQSSDRRVMCVWQCWARCAS